MWRRGLIWLAIVVTISVACIGFVPVGTGPYTAVYGPASALRAQRALLLLALAISFLSTVFRVLAQPSSSHSESFDSFLALGDISSSAPLICSLRC